MEGNYPHLLKLIEAGKFSNEELIRLLKDKTYKAYVKDIIAKISWKEVKSDERLTKKAQHCRFYSNTEFFLQTLLSQNFSFEEIENFVEEPNFRTQRETLFHFLETGFSFERLLRYAMKVNNPATWEEFWKREEVKLLSKNDLLQIVGKTKKINKKEVFHGWAGVITYGRLSLTEMIPAFKDRPHSDIVQAIILQIGSIEATEKEFMNFYYELVLIHQAEKFAENPVGIIPEIIKTNIFSEESLFEIAILNDIYNIWNAVMGVTKKDNEELLILAKATKSSNFWRALISSKKFSVETAFLIATEQDNYSCWRALVEDYDLTCSQYLSLLGKKEVSDNILATKIPWNEVSFQDCLKICKSRSHYDRGIFTDHIVGRKTLSFQEAFKLVELQKDDWAWAVLYEKFPG